jgi:hypothetical protein
MTAVRASLEGVLEACLALGDALDDELEAAARRGAITLAETAKREHWFENRTNAAENNTLGIVPDGTWLGGSLSFGAMIDTEYGEYLEARAPVLGHAWMLTEDEIARDFDDALTRAAGRARGWRAG